MSKMAQTQVGCIPKHNFPAKEKEQLEAGFF